MQKVLTGNERRQFHRIVYEAPAVLSDGQKSWPVRLIDLSLRGCLLQSPADPSQQSAVPYQLMVRLSDSVELNMNLTLVRSAGEQLAFECTHIDLDSICELRRLVELNLGDATLLERDLNALTGS